jgi:hypothetical protein
MITKALLVRLEARPGKEADVEKFLKGGLALYKESPRLLLGMHFALVHRLLESSIAFPMTLADKRIFPERLPLR